jgi:thiamine biosynthesis lipoprotein
MLPAQSLQRISFDAIGTHWEIDIDHKLSDVEIRHVSQKIEDTIELFDRSYSRFRNDSAMMQLARKPGTYRLPADAKPLFDFYQELYESTDGKVTPLIGSVLSDAGYDAAYTLKPKKKIAAAPNWEDAITYTYPDITIKTPVIIDVGAAGKGYLIDIIGNQLRSAGIKNFLIDAGGDMLRADETAGTARIGLEHPLDPKLAVGVIELGNGSVCGSAGNRRAWAGLHHIMDPNTAQPARDVIATWVVTETAMVSDGLATALFFTPAHQLQKTFSFEYVLIRSDMSSEKSENLNVELFGADDGR